MSGLNAAILAIHQRNNAAPLPAAPRAVSVGKDDEIVEAGTDFGEAEGQSFMIEYASASGECTSRRITVWGIQENTDGVPLLIAKCHEQKLQRTFRVDRIKCCIDYDGEVHANVPDFLNETFGLVIDAAAINEPEITPSKESATTDWDLARAYLRPHAEILAALSLSDGTMSKAEVAVAVCHCNHIAGSGGFFTAADQDRLMAYVKRLRPTDKTLQKSVERLTDAPPHEITDLLISAVELMDIDGNRDPAEVELVNQLSQELARIDMA
jgi:WYL domain-containing protein